MVRKFDELVVELLLRMHDSPSELSDVSQFIRLVKAAVGTAGKSVTACTKPCYQQFYQGMVQQKYPKLQLYMFDAYKGYPTNLLPFFLVI